MTYPFWECLECARVCDLTANDNCPTCGRPLPDDEENLRVVKWDKEQTAYLYRRLAEGR